MNCHFKADSFCIERHQTPAVGIGQRFVCQILEHLRVTYCNMGTVSFFLCLLVQCNWPFKFQVTWHGILRKEMRHCTLSCRFFIFINCEIQLCRCADLYSYTPEQDTMTFSDGLTLNRNTDAQRRFRPPSQSWCLLSPGSSCPWRWTTQRTGLLSAILPHLRRVLLSLSVLFTSSPTTCR